MEALKYSSRKNRNSKRSLAAGLVPLRLLGIGLLLFSAISTGTVAAKIIQKEIGKLPIAVTNNSVALLTTNSGVPYFYSINGLGATKTSANILSSVYRFNPLSHESILLQQSSARPAVLASIAVGLNQGIFLFGGYSVNANGEEKSTHQVYRLEKADEQFQKTTAMPIAVDDAVVISKGNRYLYLISGWHDIGNVSVVQIYDTLNNKWYLATPYPGTPVFGHAAAISDDTLLLTGGVKVTGLKDGKRQFAMAEEAWLGHISATDPSQIKWQKLAAPKNALRYRAAMAYWPEKKQFVIIGGSRTAYNYNGVGYDGTPASAESKVWLFDPIKLQWHMAGEVPLATMDHRGLLYWQGRFYTLGGMDSSRRVLSSVFAYDIEQ